MGQSSMEKNVLRSNQSKLVAAIALLVTVACRDVVPTQSVGAMLPIQFAVSSTGIPITDLGLADGLALAIGNQGHIVGYHGVVDESPWLGHAFVWDRGTITNLDPPGASYAEARNVNNSGQVVGVWYGTVAGGGLTENGALWDNGVLVPLGTFGVANAINTKRQVAGRGAPNPGGNYQAFLWDKGAVTYFGTLGGDFSEACCINALGQVAGWSATVPGFSGSRAFVWEKGTMTELGTFGGGGETRPSAINDRGQIVGASVHTSGQYHAFLWERGMLTDLGTLGGVLSHASDINRRGAVVGTSLTATPEYHGFIWVHGRMEDLGTLGGDNSDAFDINDLNQVVGRSTNAAGQLRAFLWQNGQLTDLGTLPGTGTCWAYRINSRSEVIGVCDNRIVVWSP